MRASLILIAVSFCWAVGAFGCVTVPRAVATPAEFELRLSPASLGRELALTQHISVVRDGEQHQFDAQFEVDAHAVRLAAVAMGQTLASMTWDGTTLNERRSPHLPDAVTGARILSDVQLAFWPAPAIEAALPRGMRLEEGPQERRLWLQDSAVARVLYEGDSPRWRRLRLIHEQYGYELLIESVEEAP